MPDRQTLGQQYQTLLHCARRPKRKLCYTTSKKCPSKEWADEMSLADIDKLFDDLETSSHNEDGDDNSANEPNGREEITSPFIQQQGSQTKELPRHRESHKKDFYPGLGPLSPELGLDCPFKAHGPVKTSSPIENVGDCIEEVHNRKEGVVSPILFPCEVNETEEANVGNRCNESDLDSPPDNVVLKKSKMSYDRAQKSRQKGPGSPATIVRQKHETKTPVKNSPSAHGQPLVDASSRMKKDMPTFLQKLRDAAQPKSSCSRKSSTPVKVTSPTVSDEDFLILEDDEPVWFSIPNKAATREKLSRTSSRDKDSSADKGAKGSLSGTAPKQPPTNQTRDKLELQTVSQKGKKKESKKMKGSEENKATVHGNKVDEMLDPEDYSSSDVKEPPKPSQRKRPRKVPSRDSEEAARQPQNTGRRASGGGGKPPAKKESRDKNFKNMKTLKDDCGVKEQNFSKVARKVRQDTEHDDATMAQVCAKHADVEDKHISNLEAQIEEKGKQGKLPAVSEESSPGDSLIIRKRKRRQPGEWWISSSQRPEETDVTASQLTPKKSKQNKKEPKTAQISQVNAKKDGAAKRRNQKQPALSPVQKTKGQTLKKGNKEKRDKQNDNLNLKGYAPGRRKLFDEVGAEQIEQQAQDRHPLHSSPLFLPERDHGLNSSNQVFQKVYQHCTSEKKSSRPTAATPKKSKEQPGPEEPGKRRRQPPGNWWRVEGSSDDVESGCTQPEWLNVKRSKERKKQPKQIKSLGMKTPKNGNLSISPIPPEGAPTPLLRAKPVSAPKTVKRSLATFKDIFTSTAETPAVRAHRKTVANNKHMVTSSPAVEITVPECAAGGEDVAAAVIRLDDGDSKSNSRKPPENSNNQSGNMAESLRSGPSSMIERQQYEYTDEINLPPSRPEAVLSASDLGAPPLIAMVLQQKDKANLTQYFQSLWSVSADKRAEITPDDFDWYFYKGKAIGIQEDLACSSICCGKLLLGSFMKKPLWVDHSAKTVFHLFTSCVKVSINGRESRVAPSQTFIVQSGEAYSIHNLTVQPAVLHFTRISAESLD